VLGHARDWNRIEFVGDPENGDFIALQCVDERVEAVIAKGLLRCHGDAVATPEAAIEPAGGFGS
jgi:hypothetical protein